MKLKPGRRNTPIGLRPSSDLVAPSGAGARCHQRVL